MWVLAGLLALGPLSACSERQASSGATREDTAVAGTGPHGLDPAVIARGAGIYRQHCAACHGANAEGTPNWHRQGPDGKYPPPPLDGSAHAWHHPMSALKQVIRDGTVKLGGNMPGWKDKLSDQDIEALVAWVQSLWPEELYRSWQAMDEKARAGQAAY